MKVVYITGPIGSGKSTLELNLRRQLDVLLSPDELTKAKDVCFAGRFTRKTNSNYLIKFGGLDSYFKEHTTGDLVNEIHNQGKKGTGYFVMSGIRSFKEYFEELKEYEFYAVFNMRSARRIMDHRINRREKLHYDNELEHIREEVRSYKRAIERWKGYSQKYPNIRVLPLRSIAFTKRIDMLMDILGKKKIHTYKRDFSDYYLTKKV